MINDIISLKDLFNMKQNIFLKIVLFELNLLKMLPYFKRQIDITFRLSPWGISSVFKFNSLQFLLFREYIYSFLVSV